MYNENLHEEEQHLIQQIAEQTERGKIDWELTDYCWGFVYLVLIQKGQRIVLRQFPVDFSSLCLFSDLLDQMLFFFAQIFIVQHDTPPFSDFLFWGAVLCFRRECRLYHHSLAEGRPS